MRGHGRLIGLRGEGSSHEAAVVEEVVIVIVDGGVGGEGMEGGTESMEGDFE